MFYNKKYAISDYLTYENLNELVDKEKELINEMSMKKVRDDQYVYVNGKQEEADSNYSLLGDISQDGTPTPTNPVAVETVTSRQEIEVCGKNLEDFSTISYIANNSAIITKNGANYTVANGSSQYGSCGFTQANLKLNPNTTYTFSAKISNTDSVGGASVFVAGVMNTTGNNLYGNRVQSGNISYITFTTPSTMPTGDSARLGLNPREPYKTATFTDIQLEKGNQSTTYEAYNGNTYEINLGKNLLQLTDGTYSNNGVEAVVNNGTITLNGTATSNSFITIPSNINSIYNTLSGNYTMSSNNKQTVGSTTTSGTYADVRIMGNNGVSFIWRNILGNQNASQTAIPGAYTNISLQIRTGSGLVYDDFVIKIQLEKGNVATSYSPYFTPIELCKIGDYQDFIRKGTGKNLYNKNDITTGAYIDASGNIVSATLTCYSDYISVKPNTTYTMTGRTSYRSQAFYDKNKNFITRDTNTETFTTGSTTYYIRVNGVTSEVDNYMLELGNTQTKFEPYGFNGKWYLYKAIGKQVYIGASGESWTTNTSSGYRRFSISISDAKNIGGSRSADIFSDYFRASTTNDIGIIFRYEAQIYCIPETTITTVEQWKTWLSSHNMLVYYQLATPTATEITDTELINQLESVWKSIRYWNYMEILPIENYDLDLPTYSLNDFVFLEDIDKIEKNIMQIGYDFFQPSGYIKNKIWDISNEGYYANISNSFEAEDLNRMITDMNILYEHKDDTPTIYNLYANENWNEETSLEWE